MRIFLRYLVKMKKTGKKAEKFKKSSHLF
jgi:hypothetical protein